MSLFTRTRTSANAAAKVAPKMRTQRELLLMALAQLGSLTDAQLQDFTRLSESTERPRRGELVKAGLVRDSGQRRKYKGHLEAIVWELTADGRRAAKKAA